MALEPLLGTEILDGDIRLGHTFYEVHALKSFIKDFEPDWFVELGLHCGGLTICLLSELSIPNYYGVEINCSIIHPKAMQLLKGKLYCGDCFHPVVKQSIVDIFKNGTGILYCDGGNKAKELLEFYKDIPSGSIIMAHDFYDGQEVIGVLNFGKLDFPKPEVLPKDVAHLQEDFTRIPIYGTRIAAFMRN